MNAAATVTSQAILSKGTRASSPIRSDPVALVASSGPPISRTREHHAVTKAQLVDAVAARTGLSRKQSAEAIDAALDTVEDVLSRGGEVMLAGFGKFSTAERAARQGVHPRTGETMNIAASVVPKFTAGSSLKQAVRP
jgi:DNA-binding protein HU-beta